MRFIILINFFLQYTNVLVNLLSDIHYFIIFSIYLTFENLKDYGLSISTLILLMYSFVLDLFLEYLLLDAC